MLFTQARKEEITMIAHELHDEALFPIGPLSTKSSEGKIKEGQEASKEPEFASLV